MWWLTIRTVTLLFCWVSCRSHCGLNSSQGLRKQRSLTKSKHMINSKTIYLTQSYPALHAMKTSFHRLPRGSPNSYPFTPNTLLFPSLKFFTEMFASISHPKGKIFNLAAFSWLGSWNAGVKPCNKLFWKPSAKSTCFNLALPAPVRKWFCAIKALQTDTPIVNQNKYLYHFLQERSTEQYLGNWSARSTPPMCSLYCDYGWLADLLIVSSNDNIRRIWT